MADEYTVESALKELFEKFGPATTISYFERWSNIAPHSQNYNVSIGAQRFSAPSLDEAMAQVEFSCYCCDSIFGCDCTVMQCNKCEKCEMHCECEDHSNATEG